MRYIICEDCGGYYKLQNGESLDDFEECHCGGNLRYAQSFKQIRENRDRPKVICSNCGAENREKAIACSKCGKKLSEVSPRATKDIHRSLKTDPRSLKADPMHYDFRIKKPWHPTKILDRISFLGLFAGIAFLVIASMFAGLAMVGSFASHNGVDMLRALGGYLIIMIFAIMGSGFVASYISGVTDYVDGLLNGALVGLTVAILSAFFVAIMGMMFSVTAGIIAGIVTLFAYALIYGALTALGGLAAAWLHKNMDDDY